MLPPLFSSEALLEETPAGRRRLTLALLALVAPPFGGLLLFSEARGVGRIWAVAAVLALFGVSFVWLWIRKAPKAADWIFPAGIAPVLSCGVAFAESGFTGYAFLGALGVPIVCAAALFELPTVIAAWISSAVVCFSLTYLSSGIASAAANTIVFAIVEGGVAAVVYRKSSGRQAARLRSFEEHFNGIELILSPTGDIAEENDGTRLPLELSSRPFTAAGRTYVHCLLRELSARRCGQANERFLAALVSQMQEAVVATDMERRVTFWSPGAERMFGWTSEEAVGIEIRSLFVPPEEADDVPRLTRRVLDEGEVTKRVPGRRKDGREITLALNLTLLREGARRTGVLGVMRDATAEQVAEEQLRSAKEAAEAGMSAKSQFLANMSHEIRTPMNGVLGGAELLLGTSLGSEQRQLVKTIHRSATSLLTVLNDILDFSKIEAGHLDLEAAPFDLEELVFDVVELFRAGLAGGAVDLVVRVASEVRRRLVGDAGRLRQVLANLVGNAAKFTASGRIYVEASRRAAQGERLEIELMVADTGIGIPEDKMAELFTAFGQADATTARRYGGTGLGLAISKRLVEAMGGTISAESSPGRGATFRVRVPLAIQNESMPRKFGGERARVVDPSRQGEIVAEQLESLGLQVERIESCDEAFAHDPTAPDVLLCDSSLWERVGECERCPPRVVLHRATKPLTEFATPPGKVLTELQKPVRLSLLARAVERALDGVSSTRRFVPKIARSAHRPASILFVEDNPINQLVAGKMLERIGASITIANNGKEALERLAHEKFDLIFMDCQMPEMDGYDATRAIREREKVEGGHIPIIALTASALVEDRERSISAGMDDHLAKPVESVALATMVERWLAERPQPVAGAAPVEPT